MSTAPELEMLVRVARALEPVGRYVVVIGGAAQQLYRALDVPMRRDIRLLRTLDVDVAIASNAPANESLDKRLEAEGMVSEVSGERTPPVTRYKSAGQEGYYVQFVTHRPGDGEGRSGQRALTVTVAGAVAERVPHIDLLMTLPRSVSLTQARGFPVQHGAQSLQVANPAAYMAQKLLMRSKASRRSERARAKDIAYLHDTVKLFAPSLGEIASEWERCCEVHPAWRKRVSVNTRELVASSSDDTRGAFRILKEAGGPSAPVSERDLLDALRAGLERVFGPE